MQRPSCRSLLLLLVVHMLASSVLPSDAATVNFIGTNADWFNASNWDAGVPTAQGAPFCMNCPIMHILRFITCDAPN